MGARRIARGKSDQHGRREYFAVSGAVPTMEQPEGLLRRDDSSQRWVGGYMPGGVGGAGEDRRGLLQALARRGRAYAG